MRSVLRIAGIAAVALLVSGCLPYVTVQEVPRVDRHFAGEKIAADTEVLVLRLTESLVFARSSVAGTVPGGRHGVDPPLFLTAGTLGRLQDELRRRDLGVIFPGMTGNTALVTGARLRELCLVFADGRVFALAPPEHGDTVQGWKRLSGGAVDPGWRDRSVRDLSASGALGAFSPPWGGRSGGCFPGWTNLDTGWSAEERQRVVEFLRRLPVAEVKAPGG